MSLTSTRERVDPEAAAQGPNPRRRRATAGSARECAPLLIGKLGMPVDVAAHPDQLIVDLGRNLVDHRVVQRGRHAPEATRADLQPALKLKKAH
ncbi:hypothetical protein ACWEP4_31850 [Streptomyces sp. NPDC004227]